MKENEKKEKLERNEGAKYKHTIIIQCQCNIEDQSIESAVSFPPLKKGTTELAMLRDEKEKRRWLEEKMTKKESVMSKVMGQ